MCWGPQLSWCMLPGSFDFHDLKKDLQRTTVYLEDCPLMCVIRQPGFPRLIHMNVRFSLFIFNPNAVSDKRKGVIPYSDSLSSWHGFKYPFLLLQLLKCHSGLGRWFYVKSAYGSFQKPSTQIKPDALVNARKPLRQRGRGRSILGSSQTS